MTLSPDDKHRSPVDQTLIRSGKMKDGCRRVGLVEQGLERGISQPDHCQVQYNPEQLLSSLLRQMMPGAPRRTGNRASVCLRTRCGVNRTRAPGSGPPEAGEPTQSEAGIRTSPEANPFPDLLLGPSQRTGKVSTLIRTALCDLLDVEHPMIQAGMGPFAPASLAAAVCNAGGLGSIGTFGLDPIKLIRPADDLDRSLRSES